VFFSCFIHIYIYIKHEKNTMVDLKLIIAGLIYPLSCLSVAAAGRHCEFL